MRPGWAVFLIGTLLAPICCGANEETPENRAKGEFFEKQIRPLPAKHCYECHSAKTADESGHLALDGRTALLAGGTRGPILVAGKPDESLLISAIRYVDPKLQMPPDGKLPNAEIELLASWVQQGGFVPEYGVPALKKGKEIDWESARKFWSFQPLQRQIPPQVTDQLSLTGITIDSRPKNIDLTNDLEKQVADHQSAVQGFLLQPVDAFISEGLTSNKITPFPPADRRTLARRLSYDLSGLPPDVDTVLEFEADQRPDAVERLVDRLLASPHFGERWARYWLDLVRYTDVTPSWLKNADQAWIYRDWVVRAFNDDRPYDDFVKRQLAADVMETTVPEDYAALGLIGLSPTYWKELRLAPGVIEVIVADEWDERVDAVSRTFLGLTVACARCHDHKFDPITSKDYYAIAGIFASTQMADRPLLPSGLAERIVEARQQVDKLEEALKKIMDQKSDEAQKLKSDIEMIRTSTPQFDAKMAHTVEEASIFVLPDGPEMTKLDVRKNQARDLPVFRRGNPGNPGEIVPRRFLNVLSQADSHPFKSGSGRREFADALFHESRGLTARVMANRIWSHHFGKGLVQTPSDFGVQGDRPSHPELLEWLATEFADGPEVGNPAAWTMKRLHRQLVTSTTYRRSSDVIGDRTNADFCQQSARIDPENRWLARMNRQRLDIEPWRDTMLIAAGRLDPTLGGPAVELDLNTNLRRTLYGKIGRDEQSDLLRLYDFPPPTSHSPARDATTTPLQQLFVLNSEFVQMQSAALSSRIQFELKDATTRERLTRCYQLLFQRNPSDFEVQLGERFLSASNGKETTEPTRWPLYVQSLFGLNELLYVD